MWGIGFMLILLLNVLLCAGVTLFLKLGDNLKAHTNTVTLTNYIFASLGGFLVFLVKGGLDLGGPWHKWVLSVLFGILTGTIYFLSLKLMIRAILRAGAGMCALWNKAGVLIPITRGGAVQLGIYGVAQVGMDDIILHRQQRFFSALVQQRQVA